MLAADHNREWKNYQRKFRDVETWTDAIAASQRAKRRRSSKNWPELQEPWKRPSAKFRRHELGRRVHRRQLDRSAPRARRLRRPRSTASKRRTNELRRTPPNRDQEACRGSPTNASARATGAVRGRRASSAKTTCTALKKFQAADLDVDRSEYELGVGDELPAEAARQAIEAEVEKIKQRCSTKRRTAGRRTPRPTGWSWKRS